MNTTNLQSQSSLAWPAPFKIRLPGARSFEVPPLRDPRYLVWGFQLMFFMIGMEAGAFSKGYDALAVSILVAGGLDFVINYYKLKRLILPQSGFIAGTGIALLLECTDLHLYALGALFAIASKHIFQFGGRHTFNPSAYGALFTAVLFPWHAISNVSQWGGLTWFTILIWCAGLLATSYARVASVAMLWMGWFAVFAIARAFYSNAPIAIPLGTITGPSFALFTFFMITDPRTTPTSLGKRALFCGLAAAIDAVLRVNQNPYAIFWGLVIASALYPFAERALRFLFKESGTLPKGLPAGR